MPASASLSALALGEGDVEGEWRHSQETRFHHLVKPAAEMGEMLGDATAPHLIRTLRPSDQSPIEWRGIFGWKMDRGRTV